MLIGFPALILIMSPILSESLVNCSMKSESALMNITNQTSPQKKYPVVYDICLDPVDLLKGTIALIFGSTLWAISSGKPTVELFALFHPKPDLKHLLPQLLS